MDCTCIRAQGTCSCALSTRRITPIPNTPTILDDAHSLTAGDRNATYGHPADDFKKTVGMWNAYLGAALTRPLTELDFCNLMAMVKLSRLEATPGHRDSLVDVAGYMRCAEMIQERDS